MTFTTEQIRKLAPELVTAMANAGHLTNENLLVASRQSTTHLLLETRHRLKVAREALQGIADNPEYHVEEIARETLEETK